MATLKQMKAKAYREELKTIESKLHPCPNIDGIDILHEHRGTKIVFTAWKGNDPLSNRDITVDRSAVLYCNGNFSLSDGAINWLMFGSWAVNDSRVFYSNQEV